MLTKTITYTDYDGNERTETFYFNLSKADVVQMDVEIPGGLQAMLNKLIDDKDAAKIMETFKSIILRAYGVKSDDGRRFIKNKELAEEFTQTEAYSELLIELMTDADKAIAFLKGALPAMTPEQEKMVDAEVQKQLSEASNYTITEKE